MFKLAFLFVVLMVVVVTSNAHPRQNHSKKVSASTKVAHHHGPESHNGKPSAKRIARSHGGGSHAPVHHPQSNAAHHPKKFAASKRIARGIHGGNHGHGHGHSDNKAAFVRPVKKNRGHRK